MAKQVESAYDKPTPGPSLTTRVVLHFFHVSDLDGQWVVVLDYRSFVACELVVEQTASCMSEPIMQVNSESGLLSL